MDILLNAANASSSRNDVEINLNDVISYNLVSLDEAMLLLKNYIDITRNMTISDDLVKKYWWSSSENISKDDFMKFIVDIILDDNNIKCIYDSCDKVVIYYTYKYNGGCDGIETSIITIDHNHHTLSSVGNFEDEHGDGWVKSNADIIHSCDDTYAVVQLVRSSSCMNKLGRYYYEYTIIKHDGRAYDGMTVIPSTAKLPVDYIFTNCMSRKGFVVTDSNDTLRVKGNVTIEAEVPISTSTKVTIVGDPGSKLTLISNADQQPCIGPKTNTGMSYGRWSRSGRCPDEIVIDGVEVTCESKVDNFTIGRYGDNDIPKITLLNNGKLICPETTGKRVITKSPEAPDGSTKISGDARYVIISDDDSPLSIMPDSAKELLTEICKYDARYKQKISYTTSEKALKSALKILSVYPEADVSLLISGRFDNKDMMLRTVAFLRLDEADINLSNEFSFECSKINVLCNTLAGIDASVENVYNIIYYIYTYAVLGEKEEEILYEMIPTYDHTFTHDVPHRVNVDSYIKDNKERELNLSMQEILMCRRDTLQEYFNLIWKD